MSAVTGGHRARGRLDGLRLARLWPARIGAGGLHLGGVRAGLQTTPARLRLAAVALVAGALTFGVLAAVAASARSGAVHSAATQTEPLLVASEGLYASLSDADATAATTFLTGGLEPPARRERYARDLKAGSEQLAALSRQAGGSGRARAALETLTTELPVYSGLVEAARANNRQGLPVGAAYLRQASTLMRDGLLPAAGQLYEVEAMRLRTDYGSGVSTVSLLAVIAVACLMLGLLVAALVLLARRSNRIVNVPIAVATLLVLGLALWMVVGFIGEQNALGRAQRAGSDPVQVLSATRVLMLRAQADESLALVARGGGEADLTDLAAVVRSLGSASQRGSLLAEAASIAHRAGSASALAGLSSDYERYLAVHRRVLALEGSGQFSQAANLAVGSGGKEVAISDTLNRELADQIALAQHRFVGAADDAGSSLSGLWLAIPLLAALLAGLVLYGISLRLREYR